jgi:ABC-type sugar transport system substrate-binding protein
MKKIGIVVLVAVVFSVAAGMVFAGGAAQAGGGVQNKLIYVCMQGSKSNFPRWQVAAMKNHMDTAKPAGIEVKYFYADDDVNKQLSQVEMAISEAANVIILNPIDKTMSATAVEKAYAAKIPVITLSQQTSSPHETAFIGSDDIESGRLQMERLYKVVGPGMRLAYINAAPGHSARILREQAYKEFIASHPDIKVVVVDEAPNWAADEALKLVEVWLPMYSGSDSIQAIAAHADCILTGAVTAVEQANQVGKIALSGIDCDMNILEKIKVGVVDDSIWQDALIQGETALKVAIDCANGKPVKTTMIPFVTVTKDNVDTFIQNAKYRDVLASKYF